MLYDGKEYVNHKGKWYYKNIEVPLYLQQKLNKEYNKTIKKEDLNEEQLIKLADGYKKSKSNVMAIKTYEEAIAKSKNIDNIKYILPRITSCYRANNLPQKSIDLFLKFYKQYGKIIESVPLFTSIAAAYCDIEDFLTSEKYAKKAYALADGKASEELKSVFGRIDKSTGN